MGWGDRQVALPGPRGAPAAAWLKRLEAQSGGCGRPLFVSHAYDDATGSHALVLNALVDGQAARALLVAALGAAEAPEGGAALWRRLFALLWERRGTDEALTPHAVSVLLGAEAGGGGRFAFVDADSLSFLATAAKVAAAFAAVTGLAASIAPRWEGGEAMIEIAVAGEAAQGLVPADPTPVAAPAGEPGAPHRGQPAGPKGPLPPDGCDLDAIDLDLGCLDFGDDRTPAAPDAPLAVDFDFGGDDMDDDADDGEPAPDAARSASDEERATFLDKMARAMAAKAEAQLSRTRALADAQDAVRKSGGAKGHRDVAFDLIASIFGTTEVFTRLGNRRRMIEEAAAAMAAAMEDMGKGAVPRLTDVWKADPRIDEAPDPTAPATAAVVLKVLGNKNTGNSHEQDIVKAFADVVGMPLPVRPTPELSNVRRTLLEEFPWALAVLDPILNDLVGRPAVAMRPTLFVGTPGCGKTTFAERLSEALDLPSTTYSCGGVADASIGGAARHWSSGEPSLPLALVRQHWTASPAIVLDEIEKVGTGRHNGNALDTLLAMLEPQSSTHWFDPYVQAPLDLSHVIWFATANSLDWLPGPLKDRFRVFTFPEPRVEHLGAIAPRLLEKTLAARGLRGPWAAPLDHIEMEALRAHWKGGSLRGLARMVEAVADARGRQHLPN
jgi:hypothetical protein